MTDEKEKEESSVWQRTKNHVITVLLGLTLGGGTKTWIDGNNTQGLKELSIKIEYLQKELSRVEDKLDHISDLYMQLKR